MPARPIPGAGRRRRLHARAQRRDALVAIFVTETPGSRDEKWRRERALLAETAPDQRADLDRLVRHLQGVLDSITPDSKGD